MDYKNLIPAPIDDKNITTDWIEEIFDDQSALRSKHGFMGFIAGVGVVCYIKGNKLQWMLIHGGYYESENDRRKALDTLYKRLQEKDKDNEEYDITTEYYRIGLIGLSQSFYWSNND